MEKFIYQVIIKNHDNEILVCHLFEDIENAIICFKEFHTRYGNYAKKIILKSTKIYII
jgi:hypothetical protein